MTDTGPSYPRYSPGFTPGSNAIGTFSIGVSPLGQLSTFDPWVTIISQYANSPILTSMITSFNAAMDQTENIENLYSFIWNVATAVGYGLDCWGRIVGVDRTLHFPSGSSYLGFEEAGSSWTGFGQGGFYSGGGTTNNFVLSDSDYRTLIYAKAATNVCDGAIPSINKILLALFPLRGICYVADNQDMSLSYTFQFTLNPIEVAIIELSGALPNPAGVVINVVQL